MCCHFCNRRDFLYIYNKAFLPRISEGSWLVHFLFQELEFHAFVQMNTLTYEWSLYSFNGPIRNLVFRLLATRGGAWTSPANQVFAQGRVLYWTFQLFFIHKKARGESLKKTPPFIKTCPGMKSWHVFLFLPDKLTEIICLSSCF